MARRLKGFTVIEVMLFLAVSGVLAAAVMLTAGANISAQRYKDAVTTFESNIQQQFVSSTAVVNNRTGTVEDCTGSPGRSDCLMLGTYTLVDADGSIVRYVVYGEEPGATPPEDEYQLLRDYNPAIDLASEQTSSMEWGTGIAHPDGDGLSFGLLVVRSPQSGSVFSFYQTRNHDDDPSTDNLSAMINTSHQQQQVICVTTAGWLSPEAMALVINEQASSANAVEVMTNTRLDQEGLATC